MKEMCTIHQKLSSGGIPIVSGSELRLPDGTRVPGVKRIEVRADPHFGALWEVSIEITAVFGEPIKD